MARNKFPYLQHRIHPKLGKAEEPENKCVAKDAVNKRLFEVASYNNSLLTFNLLLLLTPHSRSV